MESDEIFQKIVSDIKLDGYDELESIRKKKTKKVKIAIFIGLAILILSFVYTLFIEGGIAQNIVYQLQNIVTRLIIFMIYATIITFILGGNDKTYTALYQEKVIKRIINNIFNNAEYIKDRGITEGEYNRKIYDEYYEKFYSYNLITNEDRKLSFSEVKTSTYHTDSDGHTHETIEFQGIAGIFKLNKETPEYIYVRTNRIFNKKDKIKMDSSEFEKNFDVYSSNDIFTMKLLTTETMNFLVYLKTYLKSYIEFGIEANEIYFRIRNMGYLSFSPNIFNNTLDLKKIYNLYKMLKTIDDFTKIIENKLIEISD